MINVGQAVRPGRVIGLCGRVAKVGHLIRLKAVSDAHLIEVGVTGERQQARMLVLPTEPSYAHLSGGFYDRNVENLSADFPMRRFALLFKEIHEGLIGQRLDEAIPNRFRERRNVRIVSVSGTLS
jgi:hypothetical protein